MHTAKKTGGLASLMGVLLLALAVSCAPPGGTATATADSKPYFSLEDFFSAEISRLQQRLPEIAKTATKNGESETETVQLRNWANELALFVDSDINKSAWQHSYRIDSTANAIRYSSLDSTLRTQQVLIEKNTSGVVKYVGIRNRVKNALYQSDEQLDYYPDSLYRIGKRQQIVLIGENTYEITGSFLVP